MHDSTWALVRSYDWLDRGFNRFDPDRTIKRSKSFWGDEIASIYFLTRLYSPAVTIYTEL